MSVNHRHIFLYSLCIDNLLDKKAQPCQHHRRFDQGGTPDCQGYRPALCTDRQSTEVRLPMQRQFC